MKILSLIFLLFFSANAEQEEHELETGWYYISSEESLIERILSKSEEAYYINPEKIVGLENFHNDMRIDVDYSKDGKEVPMLIMQLDSIGAKKWETATMKAQNKKLAFIINNKLVYTTTIMLPISNGSISHEVYSTEDLELLRKEIKLEMNLLNR